MNSDRFPRPTKIESILGLLLLAESVLELTSPPEGGANEVVRVVVGLVAPIAVSFSRSAPKAAASALVAVWLLDAFPGPSEGTLGAGFSMLAIVFGVAAWSDRCWPWVLAILAAGTVRDLRMWSSSDLDVFIDWGFVAVAAMAGLAVHQRARHNRQLQGELEVSRTDRELHAAEAVARERATIARELHDIVAHSVSMMVVQAGTARPLAERTDAEIAGVLGTIEQTGRSALDELRRLLALLRADGGSDLAPLPGIGALPALVDRVRQAGLVVELDLDSEVDPPASVALAVYRVVQEALTNALRHTSGGQTRVVVARVRDGVEVLVSTRGGRPTEHSDGTGTGLVGLRERVVLTGGELEAGPVEGGWRVRARLPFEHDLRPVP